MELIIKKVSNKRKTIIAILYLKKTIKKVFQIPEKQSFIVLNNKYNTIIESNRYKDKIILKVIANIDSKCCEPLI